MGGKPPYSSSSSINCYHRLFVMKAELWLPVVNYELDYSVSNFGRLKTIKKRAGRHGDCSVGKLMSLKIHKSGYVLVNLSKNGLVKKRKVHRLVAEAFIENPKKLEFVNHINGIKNDNRISNLEWVSRLGNTKHAIDLGLFDPKGEGNGNSKLNRDAVLKIRSLYKKGYSVSKIMRIFNVSWSTIDRVIKGNGWQHV